MAGALAVGVDIGGSKVAAGLVDERGTIHRRMYAATPVADGPSAVIKVVAEMCGALCNGLIGPAPCVGVGSPGVVDSGRGIILAATETLPGWGGTELAGHLAEATGLRVIVGNDANAFAVGEHRYGAGRGVSSGLYITVGTSVGGAVVVQNQLLTGANHRAGEVGHLPIFDVDRGECSCGRVGHLETAASGPAIGAAYARLTDDGAPCDLTEVAERARLGDAAARAAISEGADVLGRALAGLAAVVDPQLVVVGGGVSQVGDAYWTPLRDAFHSSGLDAEPAIDIVPAALGRDSGIVGAAALTVRSPDSAHDGRATAVCPRA